MIQRDVPYCIKAKHSPSHYSVQDCMIYERDAALARAEKAERQAKEQADVLREAEHSLVTLNGLWATDTFDAYGEAQRDGLDANGAWDVFTEAMWQIDELPVLQHIKSVLATTPEPTEEKVL